MAYPYNADTALDPRTWLPGGEAVPASEQSMLPAGARVLVEDAGTEDANGIYFPVDVYGGKTLYYLNGDTDAFALRWETSQWEVVKDATVYYSSAGENPWTIAYTLDDGDLPVPVVTEFNP